MKIIIKILKNNNKKKSKSINPKGRKASCSSGRESRLQLQLCNSLCPIAACVAHPNQLGVG